MALDSTDLRILDTLQRDATVSTSELAQRVGLSQSPCWRRISQLETDGVIRRRVALLSRERLGLAVMVIVQVKLASHGWQSLPKLEMPGAMLIGDAGGTLNVPKIKGIHQAVRSGVCAAVLLWLKGTDDRWLRRLKLAAEAGRSLGVLFRPERHRFESSPAALRLLLTRGDRYPRLDIIKVQGGRPGPVDLDSSPPVALSASISS